MKKWLTRAEYLGSLGAKFERGEARRITPETSAAPRADCARAGGASERLRKDFWSSATQRHTVTAPQAQRIISEWSPFSRADCERAGGASERLRKDFWSSHRLSPHSLRCCNKVWEVASATQRHTVTAPQAQRTISEWSPFSRADCERAGGASERLREDFWSPHRLSPHRL